MPLVPAAARVMSRVMSRAGRWAAEVCYTMAALSNYVSELQFSGQVLEELPGELPGPNAAVLAGHISPARAYQPGPSALPGSVGT